RGGVGGGLEETADHVVGDGVGAEAAHVAALPDGPVDGGTFVVREGVGAAHTPSIVAEECRPRNHNRHWPGCVPRITDARGFRIPAPRPPRSWRRRSAPASPETCRRAAWHTGRCRAGAAGRRAPGSAAAGADPHPRDTPRLRPAPLRRWCRGCE